MKRFIATLIQFTIAASVVFAILYWLSYFLAASGKRFCFLCGNTIPDRVEKAARKACGCNEDPTCAVDMCMPF